MPMGSSPESLPSSFSSGSCSQSTGSTDNPKIPLEGIILEAGYFIVGEALAGLTLGLAFLMTIRSHGG